MIKGKTIFLRLLTIDDAHALHVLENGNRDFFEQFSQERNKDFYTIESQLKRTKRYEEESQNDLSYNFGIFIDENILVGTINLFQVLRGSLQSAFIGYFLDKNHTGKGHTTEAAHLIVKYAFKELKLHRIEAGVMLHNLASIRVLEKSGFHKEGLALKNVKINGRWEDHQVFAILNLED